MGNKLDFLKLSGGRQDGTSKLFTKDCEGCKFYREIERKDLCGWNMAFKYLVQTDSPVKCEVKNRETTESYVHSSQKLDDVINEENFWDLVKRWKGIIQ